MHRTPRKIETRNAKARREREEHMAREREQRESEVIPPCNEAMPDEVKKPLDPMVKKFLQYKLNATSSIKSEPMPQFKQIPDTKPAASHVGAVPSSKGSRRSSASKEARRKQLILDAAKEKAAIQMDIINKTLDAQLAALSGSEEDLEEYSSQIDGNLPLRNDINAWVEHQSNHTELPEERQAPDNGVTTGELHISVPARMPAPVIPSAFTEQAQPMPASNLAPRAAADGPMPAAPPAPEGTVSALNQTVQLLAGALKDLSTASNQVPNASLLSRISTPKDLPEFSGDQLEWLQFKQAYQESTEVCKFTDKENLWRLRKCLKGAARDAVAALFISATSPDRVMSTLELRFGNPDSIISRILQDIKKLQPLQLEYHKDIVMFAVKVQNFVEAVRAVGREEYLHGMNIVSIILSKLPTVLISKWSDYSFKLLQDAQKSRLVILSDFLNDEALKISTTASFLTTTRSDTFKNKSSEHSSSRTQTILLQTEVGDLKCLFCRTAVHKLTECKPFKKALRKVRWQHIKKHGLCYKCIISKHERDTCKAPACDKDGCGAPHHRLLHYPVNNSARDVMAAPAPRPSASVPNNSAINGPVPREPAFKPVTETLTHINATDSRVLLKVVRVCVQGPNGMVNSTALLDDGSTISLISANLARRVGLHGISQRLVVHGAFKNDGLEYKSTKVNVDIKGMDNKVYNVKLRCVEELSLPLQTLSVLKLVNYSHLADIKHKFCTTDSEPELLLGQDNLHVVIPIQVREGKNNEPSATLTRLGWSVHGEVCVPRIVRPSRGSPSVAVHTNLFIADSGSDHDTTSNECLLREIHEDVRRSFLLDSMGVTAHARQKADDGRAVAQLERSAELIDGRWYVGLPWKDEHRPMPDSRPNALTRMKGIERKMGKDPGFADRYRERVNHLFENDYAMELTNTEVTPKTYYLPHFGVDNPNKQKLRLVFDAASQVSGSSLNDYLLTGPDLLSSLLGIMLRFREHPIAVTGDIRDMFLRVKIQQDDQDALRFLWRNNPTENIKTYAMTSLIFGANCAPFVAQFVKNKNAQRFESSFPAAVEAVVNSHYMDDYIDSLPDEATAIEMVRNVSDIHRAGGFEIRNWTSNSVAVLNSVPKETLGTAAVRFKVGQQHESERTLGLIWYPADDILGFDLSLKRIPSDVLKGENRPTKRLMLRVIMSIFDVLGFLAPFTIQGRIMLQDAWRLQVDWEDYIPDQIYHKWRKWVDLLKVIKNIRIPRWYCAAARNAVRDSQSATARASEMQDCAPTHSATKGYEGVAPSTCATTASSRYSYYNNLQVHFFSDASTQAMSAVGYWRWEHNGTIHVAFIASKVRVMPVKQLTIPKAELQAALLSARLADAIGKEHKLTPARRYFWCDSSTVIHWIRNKNRTYKAFEANRLGEIDDLTRVDEWRYISTKLNVADLATRDSFDLALQNEWFKGPSFLYADESQWPKNITPTGNKEEIGECIAVVQMRDEPACIPVPDPQRFSSWLRLTRATATVLKFIARCKGQAAEIDCATMERAEILLLKHAQNESFGEDLGRIKAHGALHRASKLLKLSPVLDANGLLRVGGRIDAASDVPLDVKRPVILDGRHQVTRLIVRHYHVKAAHGSQEMVVNEIKQRYWVIKLRPTVKLVTSRCMLCRIMKSRPQVPRMGDLPEARIEHHQRPFFHCGLDLFGPMEVAVGRRREKRYGVLFTCLTVRAIHIELVASLTTDSLIMALRRMAARRGWPRHLYSDNGTNLRGADTELRRSMEALDMDVLKAEGVNNNMDWTFIPPSSPHWGGAWERLIRSVKTALKVVLKERAPRDEVLTTLMAEVENMVNGRPLVHVSVDPADGESLTPNHFLLGSSSRLPLVGEFDDSDLNLRKLWRKAQRLADMFWQRWLREILPTLVPRTKWLEEQKPLKVGDLVLVVDPNSPRNMWPKGLITQVFPGGDGRIRLVEVKTATGTYRRSAARIAPIPVSLEC
ncbi:uncharacterized protein LOC134745966 [Cydia strobilella]|uniref:uncharacterized protein LOC134745966 n=1 Tax=Cydia strobilella TaxID=1100964 RepID=UPI0030076892